MLRDGKELYYLAPDGKLMAVELTTTAASLADVPKALFSGTAKEFHVPLWVGCDA
jgi:hypothetical protein